MTTRTLLMLLLAYSAPAQTVGEDTRSLLEEGVRLFRGAQYQQAESSFQKAVDRDPANVSARLYLATAVMSQYIPGAQNAQNQSAAKRAEQYFRAVLDIDPRNLVALESLASLHYNMAQGDQPREVKLRALEQSADWYKRIVALDSNQKHAYYSLGVIAFVKFYPAVQQARKDSGMRPDDPGPIRHDKVRIAIAAQHRSAVEEGIGYLSRALEIDPRYDDAMAYMNLLVRYRGDLLDTAEEYAAEAKKADEWVQRALDTKRAKAEERTKSQLPQ